LKAAFTGSFIEDQTQTYEVKDTDPNVFRLLVQWLYTQRFQNCPAKPSEPTPLQAVLKSTSLTARTSFSPETSRLVQRMKSRDAKPEYRMTELDHMYLNMVQLYILADHFFIPRLQNNVMESLVQMAQKSPTWSTAWIKTAYEGTVEGSPLRQFAVDTLLYQVDALWVLQHRDDFPRDLLIEVTAGLLRNATKNGIQNTGIRISRNYMIPENGLRGINGSCAIAQAEIVLNWSMGVTSEH
jgi:hypothetical protein